MITQTQRRARLRDASDPNSLSTRRQLRTAYEDAATEHVRRVSVSWLCERAGVGRSTFYTHFSAVEDLAAYVVTSGFDELAEEDIRARSSGVSGSDAAHAGLARVVAMLADQRAVIEYSFAEGSRSSVVANMVSWFALYTRDTIARAYDDRDDAQIDLIAEFVSAGVVHAALLALEQGTITNHEDIVDLLSAMLPEALRATS
ncbi:TetR/AcrR family transcriptional regulator [Microbacterium sp. ZW T5_56]|uniref:TetR/AcrR family transcriptional regulator n=1 Tax=Microbacterium sp. ZW T5_56 TaxID=3378081 RepID=UPI0038521D20